ncbi:vomeronasal type-2 receptor 26-like [Bombina bombina]|uniref:vomeronasal type-2 receptor 26-like n=1 Tax=Bombina bombina TaxID=8345 RepID=UPI00235A7054|nr:vomeronasal type-2 receptor 26-like [Bombina bombina]
MTLQHKMEAVVDWEHSVSSLIVHYTQQFTRELRLTFTALGYENAPERFLQQPHDRPAMEALPEADTVAPQSSTLYAIAAPQSLTAYPVSMGKGPLVSVRKVPTAAQYKTEHPDDLFPSLLTQASIALLPRQLKGDAESCIKCPDDQWPNYKKIMCLPKTVEFLSFDDTLGKVFSSISIFSCIVTVTVVWIFIRHHTTSVVKANNRNLSYTLLLSLILSFLCSLLFIGRPVQVTCLLRLIAFGIIFTVSVSSVLEKSVTVVIAFNATKPGSKLNKWVGSRVSICLVFLCSLGKTMICTLLLALYPLYPDIDTQSYIEKIILQCNEGSITAFYLVIGYIGFLSTVSFIVAFLVRNLPASFNEAQMITFSMLVFCSVWISFIPAYLSTKGKYIVAVEIFAILASSAGLLSCIFMPKCYIYTI